MWRTTSLGRTWHFVGRKNLKKKSLSTFRQTTTSRPDIVAANILITQHARGGQLDVARRLFDEMSERTVVSWNAIIAGYSQCGRYGEALGLVSSMHHGSVKFNETTLSTVLSACANSDASCDGRQIHCLVLKSGFEDFEYVGSALMNFYANCFEIEEAKRVFKEFRGSNELLWSVMLAGYVHCDHMDDALALFMEMPDRGIVAWTTLISGFAKRVDGCEKALELFRWLRETNEAAPNEFTFDCVLRTCGRLKAQSLGRVVHGLVVKSGYECDQSVGSAIIEFYCESEAINEAMKVYEKMSQPSLNASNSLIGGLILAGRIEDAELIFSGLTINPISCNLMIKGYAMNDRVADSKSLFEKMPMKTLISMNTMISMYCRTGEIEKALELFEEVKGERNSVTWNSMISGYIQNSMQEEAFKLYETMRRSAIHRTRSTFSALLHACSSLGSLQLGQQLQAQLLKASFESNVYVGTSLIDMYSRCGCIDDARVSFASISSPNVAAWTALINGYAHHRLGSEAILLFEQMLQQGVKPNAATFVGILAACGHSGLVDKGLNFFHMMKDYALKPNLEHYACVVDLLGRSGYLKEAEEFIKEMPIEADGVIWGALLSSCWFSGDVEMGERAAEKMFSVDPKTVSAHVILSNIYALSGRWKEKRKVRKHLRGLEVKKDPGRSWIELNSKVHVFSVEDRLHPQCNVIYSTLEQLTANVNSFMNLGFA
ncbi:hypothetical protein BT93_H1516 [Corymbia citriodora subsp. variegata]|nr:hypothetical protein BT93_H1516 [Corymbia citriodora subsp. variegata]KAF8015989.1 hypothetical protein BT93_H1516 [Corymbia citriodora subsp. variegata]